MSSHPQPVTPQESWRTAQTVTQEANKSLLHYLFIPVDYSGGILPGAGGLDLRHTTMWTGLERLRRGRIELVIDKGTLNPRAPIGGDGEEMTNDEREVGQPFSVGKRIEVQHAADIAYMLASRTGYDQAGLIVVASLTGVPEPVKNWVERTLLPDSYDSVFVLHRALMEFDFTKPIIFPDSPSWTGWRLASGIVPESLVQQVRRELMAACAQGERWVNSYYAEQISEMRQAAVPNGKGGISVVSDKLRLLCREIGVESPDGLARQVNQVKSTAEAIAIAQQGATVLPQNLQLQMPPELVDLIKMAMAGGLLNKQPTPSTETAQAAVDENWSSAREVDTPAVEEAIITADDEFNDGAGGSIATLDQKANEEQPFTVDDDEDTGPLETPGAVEKPEKPVRQGKSKRK